MNGLTIFTHSIRQVVGNLGMAARISGGFWLLMILAAFAYGFLVTLSKSNFLGIVLGIALLIFLVWGISMVAVVWHRYILLEERPNGFLPTREGLNIWPYFWYGIGIALIVIVAIGLLLLAATLVMDAKEILAAFDQNNVSMAPRDMALRFAVGLLSSLIYLRLALILPAVALSEQLTIRESWSETKGYSMAILGVAVLLTLLNTVASFLFGVVQFAVQGAPFLVLLVTFAFLLFQWFYFMLNISILSTLYGHIVQKREVY